MQYNQTLVILIKKQTNKDSLYIHLEENSWILNDPLELLIPQLCFEIAHDDPEISGAQSLVFCFLWPKKMLGDEDLQFLRYLCGFDCLTVEHTQKML